MAECVKIGAQHWLCRSGDRIVCSNEVTQATYAYCSATTPLSDIRPERSHAVPVSTGVVIILYLLAMAALGFVFMRRQKTSDDYFRGGGRLPWWAVSLSIYATMFSSITFISIPAWSYLTDCKYLIISLNVLLLAPLVVKKYLPFFRRVNLTSAYEYLEERYNAGCRYFASGVFILFMIAKAAIVTYLPAVAIAAVTGFDVNLSIVLVTLLTVFYCAVGGIEAVVWGDFVQSIVLFVGTFVVFAFLIAGTDGGFAGYVSADLAGGKFALFESSLDWSRPVFWVLLVGGLVNNLASYTSDQSVVQRYITTKDERGAAKSIYLNGFLSFFNVIVFFALGVALWTFFKSHPAALDITMPKNDSVLPLFIADNLPGWASGLIFAAVAAATMSTLSSNVNSAATAFVVDFYAKIRRNVSDADKLTWGRRATVAFGLLGGIAALGLANAELKSAYDCFQLALGTFTSGLSCLFFMGIFMPFVNGRGAFAGLVADYAVCVALNFLPIPGKPHILFYGAIGMAVCLVTASLVSFFARNIQESKGKDKR